VRGSAFGHQAVLKKLGVPFAEDVY
jgi:hypothetical protein